MKEQIKNQSTVEFVELLEEKQIDLDIVRWAACEAELPTSQRAWIKQLRQERGNDFYRDLIFILLGHRFSNSEAHLMWDQILAHCNRLSEALQRNPGIEVASLDWLTNIQGAKPMALSLIERGKLENMLECSVLDRLTKLYDHDTLLALLEKELMRARRNSKAISLVMLDLDDFKQVNDRFGHQKGDDVLHHIGNIIRESIRGMDIGGRYGGEAFAIILPETDIRSAVGTAERLRKTIEARFSEDVQLTISMGIACFPKDGHDVYALVKAADKALYQAKNRGKNHLVTTLDIDANKAKKVP